MTDEELDALVQELMNRPYRRGGESNDEAAMRRQGEREQAAAALTALRAQLAEAWAKLSQRVDMHECAMAERDDATLYGVEQKARADRAEAALAAAEVATHDPAKVQALVEALEALIQLAHDCEKELTEDLHHMDFCGESEPLTKARAALAAMKEV